VRVVSLLPSATEMVCALGAASELVGVSHECDFPADVRGLPVLTRTRLGPLGSSRDIDDAVRSVVRDALSLYAIDEKALGELSPDLIVTQDLCEVCAVSLDDVRSAVARLAGRENVSIVSLNPRRLEDVLDDVMRVGDALGREAEGRRVRRELDARIRAVAERAERGSSRPRVVSIEWLEPVMLGGTWMPELIGLAGGTAVGVRAGELAPTVSSDELRALAPDVVLVKPCGFDVERAMKERELVERIAHAAGAGARVYVSDGSAYFNRPGPRLVESLEILAACIHPALFDDFANKHAAVIVPVLLG
jgi:iron complex transport system substrate-binding protein